MLPFKDLPLATDQSDEAGYRLFKDLIWYSGEVCNSCFSQVRTIGPEQIKTLETSEGRPLKYGPPQRMSINEWYERTDLGSQEHTSWDANKRFGTCFCLNCGTDCNGNHRNKSLEQLTPLVKNIFLYIKRETGYEIDGKAFGREVRELKGDPSAQGLETEVIALAFGRAIARDRATADGGGYAEASAD